MEKEWTKLLRFTEEYINGVKPFLDFAYTIGRTQGDEILCHCTKCRNRCWTRREVVFDHLIAKGFLKGYNVWVNHGEEIQLPMEVDDNLEGQENTHDNISDLLYDTFRNVAEAEGINEGAAKPFSLDLKLKSQAHRYLLFNCDDIEPYMREHDDSVNDHTKGRKWTKAKAQSKDFSEWFKTRALEDDVSSQLKMFSRGPNTVAKRHYVMETVPRDLFNMGEQTYLEAKKCLTHPFDNDGELNWVREDIPTTVTEKPLHVMLDSEYEGDSDADETLLDFME
ncbi:Transposase-associated domain [Sesbania bispinosa]|nr:Transposase-associated domain [Sesbania bispinosa]